MHKIVKIGLLGGLSVAMCATLTPAAQADLQPRPNDIVGVGSDTVQFLSDFMAEGSDTGLGGWNNSNSTRRLANFDATSDAAGGTAFTLSGAVATPKIVARAGTEPQTRPAGSGAGVTALAGDDGLGGADNKYPNNIFNYSRSSALRSCSSLASAAIPGGTHVYQVAADALQMAVSDTGTNLAPANLLTGTASGTLFKIYNGTYKLWGDIPGYTGPNAGHAIVPVVPQSGSGTRGDFLTSIGNPTLWAGVVVAEEHDPAPVRDFVATANYAGTGAPADKQDVIAPFSTGRFNLYNAGYFNATAETNNSGVVLVGGPSLSAAPAGGEYWVGRKLYIFVRENDVTNTTKWQVGSTQNFVEALFKDNAAGADGWYFRPANAALYTAAGVARDYVDLGLAASGSSPQNCL